MGPPKALRVLRLSDRLVLHDISDALRGEPSDRNSLIDAANAVHKRALSAVAAEGPNLLDLSLPTPPPSSSNHERYLVIPFSTSDDEDPASYVVSSPEQAGIPISQAEHSVEAAAGLLGILRLPSGRYALFATQCRRAGALPSGAIYVASKVKLIPLHSGGTPKDERDLPAAVSKLLESGALYYSLSVDLTRATSNSTRRRAPDVPNAFWWTWPLAEKLGSEGKLWALRTMYGFVGTNIMRFESSAMPTGAGEFRLTLVSRRSRRRAGTRYITRGVDAMGDVANFVETEQIVWNEERPEAFSSFVIIRGSIPVFWRQNNGIARPAPELDGHLTASRAAFSAHFKEIIHSYGGLTAVSLVDKQGSEGVLADAFQRHFELDLRDMEGPLAPKLVAFDFHRHCAGKEYERGLSVLLEQLRQDIDLYGIFVKGLGATGKNRSQIGAFRVNCVDCLDRTNVVQSMLSRVALNMQLDAIFSPEFLGKDASSPPRLYGESEDRFKHIWGDNADAVSKLYSGTGALKTDFTRTGKRSTTGVIGDGMKSVMRMYYKNFIDESRQEVIDILCGNAVVRPPVQEADTGGDQDIDLDSQRERSGRKSRSEDVWYSFDAVRINASGDKQSVFLELCDEYMYVTTAEGVSVQYPRNSLASWNKYEDGKSSEKKSSGKLRLIYRPSRKAPATTFPLDLQFRGGSTARESFLRAVLSWATPEAASMLHKQEVRVRVLAALNAGEHFMEDWGLAVEASQSANEVVALILPESNAVTRSGGLAAVPLDVDNSNYVLVSARAVTDRGPAIAVLVSKAAAPTVMNLCEAVSGRAAAFSAGGAVAVALEVCGTSFCFVGARLSGAQDVFHTLTSLKLGRQTFDVTNQYHHFTLAGLLGDIEWRRSSSPAAGPASRKYVRLGDGSLCYSLDNGLSVMRNSFPGLRYEDRLTSTSFWKSNNGTYSDEGAMTAAALAEGILEGRPGPQLSKEIMHCVVTISNLRGEDMKTPPGAEQISQLNSAVVLYCEYATVEGITSRQTSRPTAFPEWKESLHVVMMPSDPREIYGSFLIGQVVIPTPLADPVPVGHFVIPISSAENGGADFQVPCRLAGIPTGTLLGRIDVEFGGKDLIEKLKSTSSAKSSKSSKSETTWNDRNALPPVPAPKKSGSNPLSSHVDSLRKMGSSAAKAGGSAAKAGGVQAARLSKTSMEEVNGKLDTARKKGSKQIKSVVNRLSSLLNQPSASSSSSVRDSRQDFTIDDPQTDVWSDVQSYRDVADDPFDPVSSQKRSEHDTGQRTIGMGQGGRAPSNSNTRSPRSTTPKRVNSSQGGRSKMAPSQPALIDADDFSGFGNFQAAPSNESREKSAHVADDDALLSGLRASLSHASKVVSQPREVPVHASHAHDDLLSGLAREKSKGHDGKKQQSGDHEDWGDFEAAMRISDSSASQTRKAAGDSNSLFDF